jgi:uncharacterized phage protein (TIGR01671 family)
MKREIKFRAWDKTENTMSYSETEMFDDMIGFRFKHFGIDVETIGDIELMQFTGFKDKNDRDIYEGDLLIAFSDDIGPMEVIFENGCFKCKHKYGVWGLLSRCYDFDIASFYHILIIGNIHQNPELLKQ